jgi:hypothetical protein
MGQAPFLMGWSTIQWSCYFRQNLAAQDPRHGKPEEYPFPVANLARSNIGVPNESRRGDHLASAIVADCVDGFGAQ